MNNEGKEKKERKEKQKGKVTDKRETAKTVIRNT